MNTLPFIAWGMPSGGELLIILAIVLVVFGAKRLPELARSLGQAKREFTKATREVNEEIENLKETPPPPASSPKPPTPPTNGSAPKVG